MTANNDLEAVADICIEAHAVIEQNGTSEMLAVIRVLLHIVAREIARQNPSLQSLTLSEYDNDSA